MTYVAVAIAGSAILGAGASIYAGNKASKTAGNAAASSLAEQAREYNTGLAITAPSRQLGYGAMNQLESLFGMPSSYTPVTDAKGNVWYVDPRTGAFVDGSGASPGAGGAGPVTGAGQPTPAWPTAPDGSFNTTAPGGPSVGTPDRKYANGFFSHLLNPLNIGGGGAKGVINNALGSLTPMGLPAPNLNNGVKGLIDPAGVFTRGGSSSGSGGSNALTAPLGPIPPGAGGSGGFDTFLNSPEYRYALEQGLRGVEGAAAAGGGVSSGSLGAAAATAGGLASTHLQEYIANLMQMAGLGSNTAVSNAGYGVQTGANMGATTMNGATMQNNALMSGVTGVNNAVQGGVQNWLMAPYFRGMNTGGGYNVGSPGDYSGAFNANVPGAGQMQIPAAVLTGNG